MPTDQRVQGAGEIATAARLLGVVLGVVVALALSHLPRRFWAAFLSPSIETWWPLVILTAGLLFAIFYWLETQQALRAIGRLERARGGAAERIAGFIRPRQAWLLAPAVATAAAIAGILDAAVAAAFRGFLVANLVFWLFDLAGILALRRAYRDHEPGDPEGAFLALIRSPRLPVYAVVNALIFAVAVAGDAATGFDHHGYRLAAAAAILAITPIRHLVFRGRGLDRPS